MSMLEHRLYGLQRPIEVGRILAVVLIQEVQYLALRYSIDST